MGEAIRTERYRMVKWTNMKDKSKVVYELYDYETDPNETVNIAKQNPAIIKKLLKILNSYPTAKGL
jgi:iduronate 2-sulfatase